MLHQLRTLAVVGGILGCVTPAGAQDWPHWRGPGGNGVAPGAGYPIEWSDTRNVAWKARLAGAGVSTPIVVGDRVYVTSQVGRGVRRPGNHPSLVQGGDAAALGERPLARADGDDGGTFFVVEAFSQRDGSRVWERRIEARGDLTPVHDKNNLASPSPVSDGTMVYAWFGTGQVVALDRTGAVVWQRHLGEEIAPFDITWGHGSSPVLIDDLLILLCDHTTASYLLAVDKTTGQTRWRTDRGKGLASYSTPLVVRTPARTEIVVNSSARVDAFDAATGAALWHTGGDNRFPIPSPVAHDGVVYASRGYRSGPYLAVRAGGRGDVSGSHVLWQVETGAPYVSSLLYYGGAVYMANDVGVLTAVDAATGRRTWQQRVDGVFSASPVAADGHVYFVAESGDTVVVKAGPEPAVAGRNPLGAHIVASPALADGRIFLRTDDHLVAIGEAR